jgi:hypothetical protein
LIFFCRIKRSEIVRNTRDHRHDDQGPWLGREEAYAIVCAFWRTKTKVTIGNLFPGQQQSNILGYVQRKKEKEEKTEDTFFFFYKHAQNAVKK